MQIIDFLRTGRNGSTTSKELERALGITGAEVRRLIHTARLEGAPIISDASGYYLAETKHDRIIFARSMRSRAISILQAAQAVETGYPCKSKPKTARKKGVQHIGKGNG